MVNGIVAERDEGEVEGSGVNDDVDHEMSATVPGTAEVEMAAVTIRPVASTLTETLGSAEETEKVVPAGKADPSGVRVPVKTSV